MNVTTVALSVPEISVPHQTFLFDGTSGHCRFGKAEMHSKLLYTNKHRDCAPQEGFSCKENDGTSREICSNSDVHRIPENLHDKSKKVKFASQCSVRHMLSHKDMTPDEKKNAWVQKDEARSTIDRCLKAMKIVEKYGTKLKNATGKHSARVCTRGLESLIALERLQKEMYQLKGLENVFAAQQVRRKEGHYDDEAIAAAYRNVSNICKIRAERVASKDRTSILKYLKDVEY